MTGTSSVGPYEPCPCGSGAKYKFCCLAKDREAKQAASGGPSRHEFMKFADSLGLTEKLGSQGAEEVFNLARAMDENKRTRKTRTLSQMETKVPPTIPALVVDLSASYPKPAPVRTRGALLRPGELITRESIARIKTDPIWEDGEDTRGLVEKAFGPLLDGWESHLGGAFGLKREEASSWRPLLECFVLLYLPVYSGELATDVGRKAHVVRQFLGNFYPRKFRDCNLESIYQALKGIASFYAYLYQLGLIDLDRAAGVVKVCEDHGFFRDRLEGYFRAEGDEMRRWVDGWDYDGTMLE